VFQRLHRADEFEVPAIGLANAHRIVTRHGGTIWAERHGRARATFFFSLLRAESAVSDTQGRPPIPAQAVDMAKNIWSSIDNITKTASWS